MSHSVRLSHALTTSLPKLSKLDAIEGTTRRTIPESTRNEPARAARPPMIASLAALANEDLMAGRERRQRLVRHVVVGQRRATGLALQ